MPTTTIEFTQEQIETNLYFLSLISFAGEKKVVKDIIAKHDALEQKLQAALEAIQTGKANDNPSPAEA